MARKEFILQGFTTRTQLSAVHDLFDIADIQKVMLSVAFVSESGVKQIKTKLAAHAKDTVVFAGIRNDITSYQGLAKLHSLGCKLYTVDTGSRTIIFHPKLYLVIGAQRARLLVGSANLTLGGLNNNIEAGMLLDFDLNDGADKKVVTEIETQLESLRTEYPEHIVSVENPSILDEMLLSGRLIDEMAAPPPKPVMAANTVKTKDSIPRIKLKVTPLYSGLKKAGAAAKKISPLESSNSQEPVAESIGVELELVWESKTLTERDLNIPKGENTHATGSMSLDKGLLEGDVDHRHYFRDEVFSALTWTAKSATIEETYAKFQLVLKGISYGEFDLRVAHSTAKKTYEQNNAMTRLSWGAMKEFIAQPDLIGRTLNLYRDKADPKRFVLEID